MPSEHEAEARLLVARLQTEYELSGHRIRRDPVEEIAAALAAAERRGIERARDALYLANISGRDLLRARNTIDALLFPAAPSPAPEPRCPHDELAEGPLACRICATEAGTCGTCGGSGEVYYIDLPGGAFRPCAAKPCPECRAERRTP